MVSEIFILKYFYYVFSLKLKYFFVCLLQMIEIDFITIFDQDIEYYSDHLHYKDYFNMNIF